MNESANYDLEYLRELHDQSLKLKNGSPPNSESKKRNQGNRFCPTPCPYCDIVLARKDGLPRHIQKKHPSDYQTWRNIKSLTSPKSNAMKKNGALDLNVTPLNTSSNDDYEENDENDAVVVEIPQEESNTKTPSSAVKSPVKNRWRPGPIECPYCNITITRKDNLKPHIISRHPGCVVPESMPSSNKKVRKTPKVTVKCNSRFVPSPIGIERLKKEAIVKESKGEKSNIIVKSEAKSAKKTPKSMPPLTPIVSNIEPKNKGPKATPCPYCGQFLSRRDSVKPHIISKHPGLPIPPEICTNVTPTEKQLERAGKAIESFKNQEISEFTNENQEITHINDENKYNDDSVDCLEVDYEEVDYDEVDNEEYVESEIAIPITELTVEDGNTNSNKDFYSNDVSSNYQPFLNVSIKHEEGVETATVEIINSRNPCACPFCDQMLSRKEWCRKHVESKHPDKRIEFIHVKPNGKQSKEGHEPAAHEYVENIDDYVGFVDEEIEEVEDYVNIDEVVDDYVNIDEVVDDYVDMEEEGFNVADMLQIEAHTDSELEDGEVKQIHIENSHSPVACPFCSVVLSRKSNLVKHLKKLHPGKSFQFFSSTGKGKSNYNDYNILISSTTSFDDADENFVDEEVTPVEILNARSPVGCPFCDLTISRKEQLIKHIKSFHPGKKIEIISQASPIKNTTTLSPVKQIKEEVIENNYADILQNNYADIVENNYDDIVENNYADIVDEVSYTEENEEEICNDNIGLGGAHYIDEEGVVCVEIESARSPVDCPFCERSLTRKENLMKHVSRWHQGQQVKAIVKGAATPKSNQVVKKEVKTVIKKEPKKLITDSPAILVHPQIEESAISVKPSPKRVFAHVRCPYCELTLTRYYNLKGHILSKHQGLEIPPLTQEIIVDGSDIPEGAASKVVKVENITPKYHEVKKKVHPRIEEEGYVKPTQIGFSHVKCPYCELTIARYYNLKSHILNKHPGEKIPPLTQEIIVVGYEGAASKVVKVEKNTTNNHEVKKKRIDNDSKHEVKDVDSGCKKDWGRVWKDNQSVQVKFNFLRGKSKKPRNNSETTCSLDSLEIPESDLLDPSQLLDTYTKFVTEPKSPSILTGHKPLLNETPKKRKLTSGSDVSSRSLLSNLELSEDEESKINQLRLSIARKTDKPVDIPKVPSPGTPGIIDLHRQSIETFGMESGPGSPGTPPRPSSPPLKKIKIIKSIKYK